MSKMKASSGGATARAQVSRRLNGQSWNESGLMEMSDWAGRVMYIGSRATWRDGMLQTSTEWAVPGGGVRTDSRPPSMWGRLWNVVVRLPSLIEGRWLMRREIEGGRSGRREKKVRQRAEGSRGSFQTRLMTAGSLPFCYPTSLWQAAAYTAYSNQASKQAHQDAIIVSISPCVEPKELCSHVRTVGHTRVTAR